MREDLISVDRPQFSRRTPAGQDVKSALRVMNVLDLLGRWAGARTHVQIAEELNIPRSSLTQILKTLVRHDYLDYDHDSRGYSLGPAIESLAARTRTNRKLADVAESVLEWLTDATGESAAFNTRNGDCHEVSATVLSPNRIVAHLRLGDMAPLHATSGGQVILAYLPQAEQDAYLGRARFERYAKNALMDADTVRAKLTAIREQGFSVVNEEFTPGIGGMARPILDADMFPVASVSVTVPMTRFTTRLQHQGLEALEKAVRSLQHRAGMSDALPADAGRHT